MTDHAALEVLARRIAEDAHAGQVHKLGEPYIGHVARVVARLQPRNGCTCAPGDEDSEFRNGKTDICTDSVACDACDSQAGGELCYANDAALDRAVAWLHDVIEDCPGWDYQRLVWGEERLWADDEYTAWRRICMDAEKLTHRPNEPRARYYERVSTSPRAVRVKLADIADNTDPARMAQLPVKEQKRLKEKYRKALQALG